MQKHTKLYYNFFDYPTDETFFVPCEICGARAVDTGHIICRGSGGRPKGDMDFIENLMAKCRECHIEYGDKVQYFQFLVGMHRDFISIHKPMYRFDMAKMTNNT